MIYVVDDDPTTLKVITHKLENQDREIKTFQTAEACLEKVKSAPPDMILCDYYLSQSAKNQNNASNSEANGDQVLTAIKKESPDIPVIMYSSSMDISLGFDLLRDGADDFLFRDGSFFITLNESVNKKLDQAKTEMHTPTGRTKIAATALLITLIFIVLHFFFPSILPLYGILLIGLGLALVAIYSHRWRPKREMRHHEDN